MSKRFEAKHSMSAEALQFHIFFWDTETTGFFQYTNPPAILDLAVVDQKNGEVAQWLINPCGVRISTKAQEIHGIDASKVEKSENFGQVAIKMFDFMRLRAGSATPILCGFNSHRFDNLVLLAELARYGLEYPPGWLFADLYPHLQQRASRHRGPILLVEKLSTIPNRKLTTIYEALVGHVLDGAHRAAADAIALQAVWKAVLAHHPDFELPTINAECARGKRWGELRVRNITPAEATRHSVVPAERDEVQRNDTDGTASRASGAGGCGGGDGGGSVETGKTPCVITAAAATAAHSRSLQPAASSPPSLHMAPVDKLRGIGPKTREALEVSGVTTVGELRELFVGRLAGSAAALEAHIRGTLHVRLGEEHVLAIAEQLTALPPPP
jgi:DNA polymerase III epsilon subunit-like protein